MLVTVTLEPLMVAPVTILVYAVAPELALFLMVVKSSIASCLLFQLVLSCAVICAVVSPVCAVNADKGV